MISHMIDYTLELLLKQQLLNKALETPGWTGD